MTVCDLLNEYDAAVRPSGRTPYNNTSQFTEGPVIVTTSLNIRSISAVSEKNMEFVAQFRFRQEWFDDRLRFMDHQGPLSPEYRNFEFIHVARDQRLWIPDTFFQNERNGWYHMLDQRALLLFENFEEDSPPDICARLAEHFRHCCRNRRKFKNCFLLNRPNPQEILTIINS
ncbi:hypothetical protein ANCDUO_12786 [Ancylostoma duodenale]|uniref:Neurotransmitter-gated ion-channel ligand-binding domain-containing protein n=1 Tax=Ancylostoma duodenale TaxID=51022 RepID=A0A0C2CKK8_9BILA|nr:hypothetical protein ANCDUO_12786 [Ancylostoma duodenale]